MINFHYFKVIYSLLIGNGGHSAVLRTLSLSGSLQEDMWLCLRSAKIRQSRTSHIPRTLFETLYLRKTKRMGEKTLKRKRCLT